MKYLFAVVIVFAAISFGVVWFLHMTPTEPTVVLPTKHVTIGSASLTADVVSTDLERQQGLSGRTSLPNGRGMLFTFATADTWGIWMKDMQFPIDIIWVDATNTVVTIAPNVSPDSYPEVFYPTWPALYVLEVPAGYAKEQGIAVGQKIVVQ